MNTKTSIIPSLSLDTSACIKAFMDLEVEGIIKDDDLFELLGHWNKTAIASARHHCRSQEQVAIIRIRKVGYQRIEGEKVIAEAASTIPKIHRAARRGRKTLSCVGDMSALPQAELTKINAVSSHLGALELASTNRCSEKIEAAVTPTSGRLPLTKTLELFK